MSERRGVVIGNWKMNLDYVEAVHLIQQLGVLLRHEPSSHTDISVAPPFVDLRSVSSVIEAERIDVGMCAQHVSAFDAGAHTGEVSLRMCARLGVTSFLVGHSERRTHYAMTDDVVKATLHHVTRQSHVAVLCVGETLDAREEGRQEHVVMDQLTSALTGMDRDQLTHVQIAYEPLWAIGTGRSATAEEVREIDVFIREALMSLGVERPVVLYGGSVTPDNAADLIRQGPDGFLVGGASLKAESFLAIVRAVDDCYAETR